MAQGGGPRALSVPGDWSVQMTYGRTCFLSQMPPRLRVVQNSPNHQGTTLGLKETLLDTLHWMRRQALRRHPGRCPCPVPHFIPSGEEHPKPSFCSGADHGPCRSGAPTATATAAWGFRRPPWPGETGRRGTARGPQRIPAKSLCHHSHQRNTPGQH